jgi:tetratricopeptide (TPR) repeat protein
MTAGDQILFRRPETTRQFLFSRPNRRQAQALKSTRTTGFNQSLPSVFPDMATGSRLIELAMERLSTFNQFGAMAIRLDKISSENNPASPAAWFDEEVELARLLEALCQKENGLWGVLETELLGGFFAEKSESETLRLARSLQKNLTENRRSMVTIGVAAYPTITYRKSEIIGMARKALDHAAFFGPGSAVIFDGVSLNISADKLYDNGDILSAIQEFNQALLLDPLNVNVHNSLGVCYGLLGNYAQAVEKFTAALRIEPGEYMALYNLGLIKSLTGDREQAHEFFLKADQINGEVYEVAFQIGKYYLESGDALKAKRFLERAAAMESGGCGVYRYLGDCYTVSGMQAEAISAYQKAIRRNPQDAASMSALGSLFSEKGENPEIAEMFCRESVELSPENALFHYRLGRLYHRQKRLQEALKALSRANRLGYAASEEVEEIQHLLGQKN